MRINLSNTRTRRAVTAAAVAFLLVGAPVAAYACVPHGDHTPSQSHTPPPTKPPTTVPNPPTTTSGDNPSDPVTPSAPGTTAQETQKWGNPQSNEEFNTLANWNLYKDPGSQHGNRQPSQCVAVAGVLELRSLANRMTCGMSQKGNGPEYGRWETRVKSVGSGWKSLHIVWPNSGRWPADGERDFREHTAGANCYTGFIHYPGHTPQTQYALPQNAASCVNTQLWHNIAFEVTPTHLQGWVDGKLWYDKTCDADLCQMPGGGHITIQNDDQGGASGHTATTYVDWLRFWNV